MNRTKNNLMIIIVLGIIAASVSIGSISLMSFANVVTNDNRQVLEYACRQNAETINTQLSETETLVHTLSDYYTEEIENIDDLRDEQWLMEYTQQAQQVATSVIDNSNSLIAVYLRFNPAFTSPTAGFFLSRTKADQQVESLPPTDLSLYDKSNVAAAGWYYIPVEKGEAVWLQPYVNVNNGYYMISYVQPLYKDDQLIGVFGMDLDYDAILKKTASIHLYDSGYALLMDQNGSFHSALGHVPQISSDTIRKIINGEDNCVTSSFIEVQQLYITTSVRMQNGDYLILVVSEQELYKAGNQMIFTIILNTLAVCTVIIAILTGMINRMMNETRTDPLTRCRNRDAYLEKRNSMEKALQSGKSMHFAIVVMDINGLKGINDSQGHLSGDRLLINSCKLMKEAFPKETLYRIGGDEFVIILDRRTCKVVEKLVQDFRVNNDRAAQCYNMDCDHPLISIGYAVYDPSIHYSYSDTFKQADENMYTDKQCFYAKYGQYARRKDSTS